MMLLSYCLTKHRHTVEYYHHTSHVIYCAITPIESENCRTMAGVEDISREAIEPADDFNKADLKRHGISLPPTREDVHQLQKVYDADELYFFQINFNPKKDEKKGKKRNAANYKTIKEYLRDKFRLHKLKSTKGKRFTCTQSCYLGRICGDKETQTRRAKRIRTLIKSRLESAPEFNVAQTHIVMSQTFDYGEDEQETAAPAPNSRQPVVELRRSERQITIPEYFTRSSRI